MKVGRKPQNNSIRGYARQHGISRRASQLLFIHGIPARATPAAQAILIAMSRRGPTYVVPKHLPASLANTPIRQYQSGVSCNVIKGYPLAKVCAETVQRITGDRVRIMGGGPMLYLERYTGTRWVRA